MDLRLGQGVRPVNQLAGEPVLVVGAGGHAFSVIDTLECQGRHRVVGLLVNDSPVDRAVRGYRVLGSVSELATVAQATGCQAVIVTIGDNYQRQRVSAKVRSLLPDAHFISAIHPSAVISSTARVGQGVVILAGAVVNCGTEIGEGCLINSRASVDHDCTLEAFSSVAPGATLGGNVVVGQRSSVGLGAAVVHRISIGADTVIGAGAVVVADQEAGIVAFGSPCRMVRTRAANAPYL